MFQLNITQFVLPNGKMQVMPVPVPDALREMVTLIGEHGYRFEVEELTTGEWSFDVLGEDEDGEPHSLAMMIVPNILNVSDVVSELIWKAHANL